MVSKPDPLSSNRIVQLFATAVVLELGQHLGAFAIEDTVDGVLAGETQKLT